MKKAYRFLGLLAAAAITAVTLTLSAGCGDVPSDVPTIETDGQIYHSKNSLFSYTLNDDNKATLITYRGNETKVIVNVIDGKQVVAIAEGAFIGNTSIKELEISDKVRAIGKAAFADCTALESVTFRGTPTLARIEESAFSGCTALKSFAIPASLSTIGDEAFMNCKNASIDFSGAKGLTEIGAYAFSFCGSASETQFSVDLPVNLTKIGTGAFYGSLKIDAFSVSEQNTAYSSKDGILYNKAGDTLVLFPAAAYMGEEFTVPSSVRTIAGGAFAGAGIKRLVLPEGLTEIGGSAFYSAYAMESIVLPSTLKSIDSFAFLECVALKEIDIPDGTALGTYLFRSCSSLTRASLPRDLTELPDGIFDSCAKLTSVSIPDGVTVIGQFAFNYCTALPEIKIPQAVRTVRSYAFRNCQSLTAIDLSGVSEIGDFALQYCNKLTRADISGVTEIPAYLFEGAALLSDVVYSDSLTAIGNYAFLGCDHLAAFNIPTTTTVIGDYAFAGCTSLTEITVPASVSVLGKGAFYGAGLTKAVIEAEITEIPASLFDGCKKLTTLSLPATVEVIGMGAFSECVQLTDIPLAGPVKHVMSGAFTGCRKLTRFIIGTEDTAIGTGTYYGCDGLTAIVIPEGITAIGTSAFSGCAYLESVTYPSTLKQIDAGAFSGCVKLARAELPSSLNVIGESAYLGCTKLTKITVPTSVIYVGDSAFAGTQWLKGQKDTFIVVGDGVLLAYNGTATDIVIPDTVKRIPDHSFTNLKSEPTSFTIPRSVEYIGVEAFAKLVSSGDSTYFQQRYVKIRGYEDSYAEIYANREYYTFEALD
ncbi:MAG: leucine-rich repeat protein [Clostridia bacterium]|nr:leucine-rich repeat protein [Clostridia bacterium]